MFAITLRHRRRLLPNPADGPSDLTRIIAEVVDDSAVPF